MSLAGMFDTYYSSPEFGSSYSDYDFDYIDTVFQPTYDIGMTDTISYGMGDDEAEGMFYNPNETGGVAFDLADERIDTSMYDAYGYSVQEGVGEDVQKGALFAPRTSLKEDIFDFLGIGKETAKAISAFAKAAQRGGGKQGQAQGRGRTGPALPTSARAPTTAAGRTSRARQATSGERAVQAAISQSNRAQSAARAIADQMARAGTVTTTNDLADMISGSTKPAGTKTKLPGTQLRQLAIPRTQMA